MSGRRASYSFLGVTALTVVAMAATVTTPLSASAASAKAAVHASSAQEPTRAVPQLGPDGTGPVETNRLPRAGAASTGVGMPAQPAAGLMSLAPVTVPMDPVVLNQAPPRGSSASSETAAVRSAGSLRSALATGAVPFAAPATIPVPGVTTGPTYKVYTAGTFDSVRNVDVAFGGNGDLHGPALYNITWTWDGTNWTTMSPTTSPSAREAGTMAFDTATSTAIMFGGYDGTSTLADTWSWNGTNWTQLHPATSPPAREQAAMAYDSALGEIVLFGGNNGSTDLHDTWVWNGTTWASVTTPSGLTARSDAGMAYDATAADIVLYGGQSGSGTTYYGDTWLYSGTGWTQVTPTHSPGVRAGMGFTYDAVLGRVLFMGGDDTTDTLDDEWVWNGTDWLQGVAPNYPVWQADGYFVTAAGHGQVVGEGGTDDDGTLWNDTYLLDWGQFGTPKSATFETHQLDDRASYGVNPLNGNMVISSTDLSVAGPGPVLQLDRIQNSRGGYRGWTGEGTELTNSFDTWWASLPDGSVVLTGVRGEADNLYFHKSGSTFTSPPGADATLATAGTGYTLTFNASGEKLTFNSTGDLITDADRNGNANTYTWTSGTDGFISTITAPGSRVVTYTQDMYNRLAQVVDAAAETTTYYYISDDFTQGLDHPKEILDPNNNETDFGYDFFTNLNLITFPETTPNTQSYTYNPPVVTGSWQSTVSTDANSHATTYAVAYAGQVIKATDALSHTRSATFTANNDILTSVDAIGTGNTTTYGYDALNNPISAAISTGATATAQYASGSGCTSSDTIHPYLVKCVNDGQGNQTAFSYDTPGNTLTDKNVTTGATLTYTYNPGTPTCGGKVGQLCTSQDGNSHTTSYQYNSAGQLTTITPPTPLVATTQTFDTAGRVATVTDGKGQKSTYTYDGDDRITQVLTNGATTCSYTAGTCVTYVFDSNGNRTSMHDKTGTTGYAYDGLNRQTVKTLPSTATMTETYDPVGNVKTYVDAGGTVTYGYNAANQLTSLAEPGGSCSGTVSLCTTFGVNNNGARTTTTYPGGTVMTTTLDNSGRPTEVKAVNGTSTISDFTYSYAPGGTGDSGVVQKRVDAKNSLTTTYSYDAKNELTKAVEKNSGGTTTASWLYCYDNAGNRTSYSTTSGATCPGATTTYTYNAANELTATNGSSTGWSYDADGNETAGNSTTPRTAETYTATNQLTSVTTGGSATAMSYAGLSNDERVTSGSSTTFQTGQEGLANQTVSSTTTSWTRDPAGTLVSERAGGNHYYYIFDGQGTVVALVNSTGTAANTYSYDPYGNTRASTGTTTNPLQYISGYKDPTGVYHLGARYYDTNIGRFTQPDPSGQGPNLYAYVTNNPMNLVDPTGRFSLGSFLGSVGVTAASAFKTVKVVADAISGTAELLADAAEAEEALSAGDYLLIAASAVGAAPVVLVTVGALAATAYFAAN